jgi:hypothetical protein
MSADYAPGMNNENSEPSERRLEPPDAVEQRSATGTAIQAVEATGVLSLGLGTLGIGAAKVKEAFGGGQDSAPPPSAPAEQPPRTPSE